MVPILTAFGEATAASDEEDGGYAYDLRFDLLPGATMHNASCLLTGAMRIEAITVRSRKGPGMVLMATRESKAKIYCDAETGPDVEPYAMELYEALVEHLDKQGLMLDQGQEVAG